MKKVMIIVWKWVNVCGNNLKKKQNRFECGVQKTDDILIGFTRQRYEEYSYKKINDACDNNLKEDYKVLLLLHGNENGKGAEVVSKLIKKYEDNKNENLVVKSFGGGTPEFIYTDNGLITEAGSLKAYVYDKKDNKIKDKHFKDVWDHYFIKKNLFEFKRKIVSQFLPLAIDIQGLSEVGNDIKRKEYFNEVKKSYSKDDINKLKITLEEIGKENLEIDDKKKCLNLFGSISNRKTDRQDFCDCYCDSKSPDKFFLPAWLKNVAKKIDEKIEQD